MRRHAKDFRPLVIIAAAFSLVVLSPVMPVLTTPALAQRVAVSAEFRTALEPYGTFRHVARWGEVWVPADVSSNWRPYRNGHWVYSNDYGWYWVADEREAAWGWIVYHYGRWVWIDGVGWGWVPGRQWGPAWVDWRRGHGHIGWAPLSPDEILVEARDDPDYWTFVEPREFLAEDIAQVVVEPEPVFFRETVVVNETVIVRDRDFAVNPGIAPAIVAASVGRPVRAFDVRPRVLAGTVNLSNSVVVRTDELRRESFRRSLARETNIRQSANVIQPAKNVPAPQQLGRNERGRLGDQPPRAATGATTGAAPSQSVEPQPGTRPPERGRPGATTEPPSRPQPGARERAPSTTGAAPEREPQPRMRQGAPERGRPGATTERPSGQPQPRVRERAPSTTGAAPEREPQPRLRQGAPERGRPGAATERPSRQPQPGVRERAPSTTGAAPQQRGPQPGARQRAPSTTGAAPQRGPQPRGRENGPQRDGER